ncbi:MAG TPA: thioredoxin domain-containing protein [Chthoniobacterales bacterium]|nr:thioredoxin domain-containing protein [Chthoniobacterales bacterium]
MANNRIDKTSPTKCRKFVSINPVKRALPFVIIAAVAIVTIGAGAVTYRAKLSALVVGTTVKAGHPGINPDHVRGDSDAVVTLEEFADFQCPSCAITTIQSIRPLEKDFKSRLRIVFWHFPLPNHQHGREAALAAEAASRQGKFWEMHDLLYQNQSDWSKATDIHPVFEQYAQQLKMDVTRFKKDFDSKEVAKVVDREREQGVSRGVQNTPTIFINGRVVPPPFNPERLHEAVEAALSPEKNS